MHSHVWAIEVSAANVANKPFFRKHVQKNENGLLARTVFVSRSTSKKYFVSYPAGRDMSEGTPQRSLSVTATSAVLSL